MTATVFYLFWIPAFAGITIKTYQVPVMPDLIRHPVAVDGEFLQTIAQFRYKCVRRPQNVPLWSCDYRGKKMICLHFKSGMIVSLKDGVTASEIEKSPLLKSLVDQYNRESQTGKPDPLQKAENMVQRMIDESVIEQY